MHKKLAVRYKFQTLQFILVCWYAKDAANLSSFFSCSDIDNCPSLNCKTIIYAAVTPKR